MGFRRNRSKGATKPAAGEYSKEKVAAQICCDFKGLLKGGSDLSSLLETPSTAPASSDVVSVEDGGGVKPLSTENAMWFACVLWDSNVLDEFKVHEEMENRLYSTLALGRLMSTCVHEEKQSWPGIRQMDWKKPFMMVDIITCNFGVCGSHACLRVEETPTGNTVYMATKKPKFWDLIISEEFKPLADEMVRKSLDQVKTTVILWGARKDAYPVPWSDGADLVLGEIFLKSWNAAKEEPISVLIFHHESIPEERIKLIQTDTSRSELWRNFQEPSLQYKWFCNSSSSNGSNHFSLHAVKYYRTPQDNETPKNSLRSSVWEEESMPTTSEENVQNQVATSESEKQLLLTQEQDVTENGESDLNKTVAVRGDDLEVNEKLQSKVSPITWGTAAGNNGAGLRRSKRNACLSISNPSSSSSKKSKQDKKVATAEENLQQEQDAEADDEEPYQLTALLEEL